MQKAIIIQSGSGYGGIGPLSADELNKHLKDGWRFVSACPFGCSVARGGTSGGTDGAAAVLVVIEKP